MNQDSYKLAKAKTEQRAKVKCDFAEVLSRKYDLHCKRTGIQPTHQGFIFYLIERRIIEEIEVCRYMVIERYPEKLYECDGKRTEAVYALEAEIPVAERTIFSWIKNFQRRYR